MPRSVQSATAIFRLIICWRWASKQVWISSSIILPIKKGFDCTWSVCNCDYHCVAISLMKLGYSGESGWHHFLKPHVQTYIYIHRREYDISCIFIYDIYILYRYKYTHCIDREPLKKIGRRHKSAFSENTTLWNAYPAKALIPGSSNRFGLGRGGTPTWNYL